MMAMVSVALRILFWLILVGAGAAVIWRATRRTGPAGLVPAVAVGIGMLIFGFGAMTPAEPEEQFNIYAFGTLPIQEGGRTKPLDTYARVNMMQISDSSSFTDDKGDSQPAVKFVLDLMSDPQKAADYPVFRVVSEEVLTAVLGLEPRPGFRYSYRELLERKGNIEGILKASNAAREVPKDDRTAFDRAILELREHLTLFQAIASRDMPRVLHPASAEETDWEELGAWFPDGPVSVSDARKGTDRTDVQAWALMLAAYKNGDAKTFNAALTGYKDLMQGVLPEKDLKRIELESFFNHLAPFTVCAWLYVIVFLLACVSWVAWADTLNAAAFSLAVLTLSMHTWALFTRMILMDRPLVFVTNLYSSAVFIGWGAVLLCVVLERIYRNSIGTALAAVLGALTLLVARGIATGDTVEMLTAVLDTNFWLATHVTCVTLGYTATFVAGFIGIALIVLGVFTPRLNQTSMKDVGQMLYGILCFAMFLSFVGTVLGGIWADQSWGRFWGWDPKENGALLIVIWNALILHARWAGMVKQRGMAVLAVAGNIVTAWSWFGTNMLGVGLHSYGFMSGARFWLVTFIVSQLMLIGIGSLPFSMWKSFNETTPEPPKFEPPVVGGGPKRRKGRNNRGEIQPA